MRCPRHLCPAPLKYPGSLALGLPALASNVCTYLQRCRACFRASIGYNLVFCCQAGGGRLAQVPRHVPAQLSGRTHDGAQERRRTQPRGGSISGRTRGLLVRRQAAHDLQDRYIRPGIYHGFEDLEDHTYCFPRMLRSVTWPPYNVIRSRRATQLLMQWQGPLVYRCHPPVRPRRAAQGCRRSAGSSRTAARQIRVA